MRNPTFLFRNLVLVALLNTGSYGHANDIQVTNVQFITAGQPAGNADVRFDVSWQNSWRSTFVNNWDAAWVFVKYRTVGNVWTHVYLQNSGHTGTSTPTNTITSGRVNENLPYNATTNPVTGAFIHRSGIGSGTFTVTDVRLKWNYAAQGLLLSDIQEIKVFALEMVYVPQGAFAVGSGGTEENAFTLTTINTADATVAPTGSDGFNGSPQGGHPAGATGNYFPPISPNFPNGFKAFYCMKYEVSQQGYVDFLNTLTYEQQANNTAVPPDTLAGTRAMTTSTTAPRRAIRIAIPGIEGAVPAVYGCDLNNNGVFGEPDDGMDLACPDLRPNGQGSEVSHIAAYVTWSGLRPMSEMEFEKACRGTAAPVPNEYAWGNTSIANATYALGAAGTRDEGISSNFSTTAGNCTYNGTGGQTSGPVRVGIFAAQPGSTDRVAAGAGYWGILELDGNLAEYVLGMGAQTSGTFQGQHGTGNIDALPSHINVNSMKTRSGGYSSSTSLLGTSSRFYTGTINTSSTLIFGGRGVRSAPNP